MPPEQVGDEAPVDMTGDTWAFRAVPASNLKTRAL